MKILVVGSDNVWALENTYVQELKKFAEVDLFNAHGLFLDYHQSGYLNKILYKIGFSGILKKINDQLYERVAETKPHVVFIFKGMEIFPSTLVKIKKRGVKLINFNGDHPFKHFSKGSGNKNVTNSIKHFDLYLTYSQNIVPELKKQFGVNADWLPFGYHTAIPPDKEQKVEKRVCFIGNHDQKRGETVQKLLKAGIEVDVYGSAWPRDLDQSDKLSLFSSVFGSKFQEIAQKYLIQLNVFRPHNLGSHNMRTFEMPALGCIMLAPRSKEHQHFFEENREVFLFDSDTEMVEKCKKILVMGEEETFKIRKAAYERSIYSRYSYEERTKTIINWIEELKV